MQTVMRTDQPQRAVDILSDLYDIRARPTEGGVIVEVPEGRKDQIEYAKTDWPEVFTDDSPEEEGALELVTTSG